MASTRPACFFRPKTPQDVTRAILISRSTRTPFAVKSGGHVLFAGASSCHGGVTVDLVDLNQITLLGSGCEGADTIGTTGSQHSHKVVSIGPGNS